MSDLAKQIELAKQAIDTWPDSVRAAIGVSPRITPPPEAVQSFQLRVWAWMKSCFLREDACTPPQRAFRFIEEALELVQAVGTSKEDVLRLVDYTYSRPLGSVDQEIGGVMVTLAGLAQTCGSDLNSWAENELRRCIFNSDKIRAKDLAKPQRSPLPTALAAAPQAPVAPTVDLVLVQRSDVEYCLESLSDLVDYNSDIRCVARRIRNALKAQPAAPQSPPKSAHDELAWLVENGKQGGELRYRYFDDVGLCGWTTDPYQAMHFCRRIDAELFCAADEDAWRIVEHMFCGAAPQAQAPQALTVEQLATAIEYAGGEDDPWYAARNLFDCYRASLTKESGHE